MKIIKRWKHFFVYSIVNSKVVPLNRFEDTGDGMGVEWTWIEFLFLLIRITSVFLFCKQWFPLQKFLFLFTFVRFRNWNRLMYGFFSFSLFHSHSFCPFCPFFLIIENRFLFSAHFCYSKLFYVHAFLSFSIIKSNTQIH